MKTAVCVPVKDFGAGKNRLAPVLTPKERAELARALFEATLSRLAEAVRAPDRIVVVTDSDEVASRARSRAEVIREDARAGETAAVETAASWAEARGFDRLAVLPADCPGLDPREVERLLAIRISPPALVLSPATGDDGTNALLAAPPTAVPFRFGVRSFDGYRARAAERGVACEVVRLESLVLDLDAPEDLATFLRAGEAVGRDNPAVRRLLDDWNAAARVAAYVEAAS